MRALLLTACIILVSTAVSAPAQNRSSVNECTLLTDPTQLRQCVDRFRDNETRVGRPGFAPDAFSPHEVGSVGDRGRSHKVQAERAGAQQGEAAGGISRRRTRSLDKAKPPGSASIP